MSKSKPFETSGRMSGRPRFGNVAYRILNLWPFVVWGLVAACGLFLHWTGNRQSDYYGYFQFETSTLSTLERGRVESVVVETGEQVSTNQTLIQMDTEAIDSEISAKVHEILEESYVQERERILDLQSVELRLDEWKIQQREDRAELKVLQDELIHLETLLSKQLINRDDYVRVKAKITALETSLESIPNVIGKLENNLVSLQDTASKDTLEGMASDTHPELKPFENRKAGSSIRANRPGVVSMVYKKEGEITNAGEPIVQLMHTDSPKVVAFAPLSSIETLQADQTVEVVSTGRKGTTAFGKITNISPGSFDLNDIPGIRKSDTIGYWFIVELEEGHVFHHREPVKIVCESKSPLTRWLAWIGGL